MWRVSKYTYCKKVRQCVALKKKTVSDSRLPHRKIRDALATALPSVFLNEPDRQEFGRQHATDILIDPGIDISDR